MHSSLSCDLIYWLAVSHLQTVKLARLRAWLDHWGSFQNLFEASAEDLNAAGFTVAEIEKIKSLDWSVLEAEEKWYATQASVITLQDPRYPVLLKELADPPLVLYVSGDPGLLSAPQVGIVGTRYPSPLGKTTAESFARALAEQGLVITSGLAAGIDGCCHQGALEAGGKTIAVMGTGLKQIYPHRHWRLAEKVRETGALVSEFPLNTGPTTWNFPRRNRIISGLSLGVLVIEAALRSGSLITARHAMEQNREVFAIPGSIHHPLARGCHHLIRQGAKLVESVADIIEELAPLAAFVGTRSGTDVVVACREDLEPKQEAFLQQIEFSVTAFDSLLLRSGLTATEVSSMLLILELKGYIQAVQGGYMRCV